MNLPRRPFGVSLQLAVAMVALAVLTVAVTGFLTHLAIDSELAGFGKRDLKMTAERTADRAEFDYERAGGWEPELVRQLVHEGALENHTVVVRDAGGDLVRGSAPREAPDSHSVVVRSGGRLVGTVSTGHRRGGYLQLAGDRTGEGLNKQLGDGIERRLAEAGIIAGLLALLLGLVLALRMARPLKRVTEVARRMAHGEIETRATGTGGSRETRELATTLDRLAAALRRQDELRRATVADVVHELRGALVGVVGRLEALQDGIVPDEKATLDRTARDARRLNRLVDDVLLLAEAQKPSMLVRKRAVDLEAVCKERGAAHAERFAARGIDLECDVAAARVDGDPERLAQILDNLLSNALRYTDPEGRVRLALEVRDGEAVVQVSDTGIGIAPDQLPRIFDRFWRDAEARVRVAEGSGVGLALVRDLVLAHDGRVEVESRPGKGSTFSVHLPVTLESQRNELLVREPAAAGAGAPTVWRLRGELDTANAARIEAELLEAVCAGSDEVMLDLTDVDFIDSSGLGSLMAVAAEVRSRGGHLAIVASPPHVRRVFDLLQVDELLEFAATRGDAMATFAGSSADR